MKYELYGYMQDRFDCCRTIYRKRAKLAFLTKQSAITTLYNNGYDNRLSYFNIIIQQYKMSI